jgi:hypothetical protein
LVLGHQNRVNLNLNRAKGRSGNELEGRVAKRWDKSANDGSTTCRYIPDELAAKPEEWLLEVVVGLCRDLEVLEVLLAVEGDCAGLDLALLHKIITMMIKTTTHDR